MQITSTRIITQVLATRAALPIRKRRREPFDVGKTAKPSLIIWNDRGDLCLLQHDFRNENGVGIGSSSPGKIAPVLAIPAARERWNGAVLFFISSKCSTSSLNATSNAEIERWTLDVTVERFHCECTPTPIKLTTKLARLARRLMTRFHVFAPKPYTIFFAQKNKLSVAVYEKGPKVLVQGQRRGRVRAV